MPTAAKLVAALCLAGLAWYISDLVIPLFADTGRPFNDFHKINAAIGAVLGWRIVGARAGRGMTSAIGLGLTGAGALAFWGLFFHASAQMIKRSLRKLYDGPVEAVTDVFAIGVEFAQIVMTVEIVATFVVGGILCGIIAELTSRRAS